MDHLGYPDAHLWQGRQDWFTQQDEEIQGEGSYFLSEQACALSMDVQAAFCIGAWAVVVIAAAAVSEAQLRLELPGTQNLQQRIDAMFPSPNNWLSREDLHWLRRRRNALVHANEDAPALTVDQQWDDRAALENDARRAVVIMLKTLYLNPGT